MILKIFSHFFISDEMFHFFSRREGRLKCGLRRLQESAILVDQEDRGRADPGVREICRRHRVQPASGGYLASRVPQVHHNDRHQEVFEDGGEHGRLEEVARDLDLKVERPATQDLIGQKNLKIGFSDPTTQNFMLTANMTLVLHFRSPGG